MDGATFPALTLTLTPQDHQAAFSVSVAADGTGWYWETCAADGHPQRQELRFAPAAGGSTIAPWAGRIKVSTDDEGRGTVQLLNQAGFPLAQRRLSLQAALILLGLSITGPVDASLIPDPGISLVRYSDAPPRTETYEHDHFGRLTATIAPEGTTEYGYNGLGQMISADAPGTAEDLILSYDALGRLKQITQGDGTIISHSYQGAGTNRLQTVIDPPGDGNTKTITYRYAGSRRISETTDDQETGTITTEYFASRGRTPLWSKANGLLRVPQRDAQGNVVAIQEGTINELHLAQSRRYSAFGEPRELKTYSTDTNGNPVNTQLNAAELSGYGYRGMRHEPYTLAALGGNQIHTDHRNYAPAFGTFTQDDPARAGYDWYGYAGGDPVNRWDPTGLAAYFFDGTNNFGPVPSHDSGGTNIWAMYLLSEGSTSPRGSEYAKHY